MADWHYCVPPDLLVRIRAPKRPALLSRVLGEEAPAGEPSLVLDLASRTPATAGVLSIDRTAGSRTVRGVRKMVPWSCTISSVAEGPLAIEFHSPVLREYLAFHIALLPALRRLLLHRNVALIPGAAFERNGEVTVLAGMTGGGKTSLLLGALERGAQLVGDEYIALSETGDVTPVVRVLALRRGTLGLAPKVAGRLSASRHVALRAAEIASAVTRGRLDPLSHVSPAELRLPAERAGGAVRRLFWLEPDGGAALEPMTARSAMQQLSMMQAVHDLAFGDIGPFLDPESCAGVDQEARWRSVIERGLQDATCYRLSVRRGGLAEALERMLAA